MFFRTDQLEQGACFHISENLFSVPYLSLPALVAGAVCPQVLGPSPSAP